MNEVEKYTELKSKVESLNQRLSKYSGIQQEKLRQRDALLKKYGVTTLEELKLKKDSLSSELSALESKANDYINRMSENVSRVEQVLSQTSLS